jgi:hypothetical protein
MVKKTVAHWLPGSLFRSHGRAKGGFVLAYYCCQSKIPQKWPVIAHGGWLKPITMKYTNNQAGLKSRCEKSTPPIKPQSGRRGC